GPKTSIICSPMTSLKTSIKTITYLSDTGCLEIQGASLHGKELDGVIKYLNDTRHAAKANVQNLNGQQLYGLLVGGGIINAAVLAGMLKTAAFVVPAAGAVGGAAKAYESPVIRNALLRLANTPKGSTAYDRAISTVTQSLTTAAQASQKEAQ
ncbi:hypothetical protein AB0U79_10435, partial [Escherichia coli]